MSSHLPTTQNKSWWSRTKPSKSPTDFKPARSYSNYGDDHEKAMSPVQQGSMKHKDSAGLRFKTLGTAIGFKSRKAPSLAIQDPPSTASEYAPPAHNSYPESGTRDAVAAHSHRPLIKPILTSRSTDNDGDGKSARTFSEPRTPSDHPRASYQPSVLTFSEMDPFAAAGVIIQQGTHDPNRLSVYSDSSVLDPHHKSPDFMFYNRISYGSTSSNSHGHSSDSHSARLKSPRLAPSMSSRSDRQRPSSPLQRDISLSMPESKLPLPRRQTASGSNSSSSTVTSGDAHNRLSEPPPGNTKFFQQRGPTSASRPRGMTIATPGGSADLPSSSHLPPPLPLQQPRKPSYGAETLSSSHAPSPSPVTFSRSRSSTTTSIDSPMSASSTRPLVLVRKASASRLQLPPLSSAPPSANLPPPPLSPSVSAHPSDSLDDLSAFPDPPSSSSSSLSFAPSIDVDFDSPSGDAINHLMRQTLGHSRDGNGSKKKHKGHAVRRNEADLSPSRTLRDLDLDIASLSSPNKGSQQRAVRPDHSTWDDGEGSYHRLPGSLKKAASQQSLHGQRYSSASFASSVTSSSACHDDTGYSRVSATSPASKAPRKQRSFHHSRLPLPPLPTLRHANSCTGTTVEAPAPFPTSPTTDQQQPRRGSVTSPGSFTARKRLFSGSSSRRSTSSQTPVSPSLSGDDDMRSIYSVDELRSTGQKIVMSFGNLANPLSLLTSNACVAPSSYLNDASDGGQTYVGGKKRASQSEYIPQHIMSPADMLKLEQQLADEAADNIDRDNQDQQAKLELELGDLGDVFVSGRKKLETKASKSRVNSRLSTVSATTVAFGEDDGGRGVTNSVRKAASASVAAPPSGTPRQISIGKFPSRASEGLAEPSRLPMRSSSVVAMSTTKPALSVRPSTAQPSLSSPTNSTFTSTYSPDQPQASLPPPPRTRTAREQQHNQQLKSDKRTSVVPMHPLSPPPVRNKTRFQGVVANGHNAASAHPPSAFDEKALRRRSIMRKPSFLDIEDEVDAMTENLLEVELDASPSSPTLESSFLDMERGKDSFDTIRSSDSLLYL